MGRAARAFCSVALPVARRLPVEWVGLGRGIRVLLPELDRLVRLLGVRLSGEGQGQGRG